jgi:hypothetical protein
MNDVRIEIFEQGTKGFRECEGLEYRIFLENEYIKSNPSKRISDFDKFGRQAMMGTYLNEEMIGVIRLIYSDKRRMNSNLFPTLYGIEEMKKVNAYSTYQDIEERVYNMKPNKVVDVVTISTSIKKIKIILNMINGVINHLNDINRPIIFAFNDKPFHLKMKRIGIPLIEIGDEVFYWGSYCFPAYVDSRDIKLRK